MRRSVYSFGQESPIKFHLNDEFADTVNEAIDKYLKAQISFNQRFGRPWSDRALQLAPKWTPEQREAWDVFWKFFDKSIQAFDYHPNDIMEDFLVKNVQTVAKRPSTWGQVLGGAVMVGTFLELLRRL